MILYKNTKAIVRPPDDDTDFFDVISGVLQGDTFAYYKEIHLFIICLDYVLRMSLNLIKENGFTLKKQEADDILQKL